MNTVSRASNSAVTVWPRQQVVRRVGLGVMQLAGAVTARHDLHAARLDRRIGQRDPRRHLRGRLQPEIGRVLVPADKGRVVRALRPDRQVKQPDVGADQILDRVEHRRVMHDLVDPGEQEVRLEIVPLAELPALVALEAFEPVEIAARLLRAERRDRKDKAVALVPRHLSICELFAHTFVP
jgi:hypothetical protein